MTQFHLTRMGAKFYNSDVPKIAKSLEVIAEELKRANDLKEKELNINIHELEK